MSDFKACSRCKETKPLSEFYKRSELHRRQQPGSCCKTCYRLRYNNHRRQRNSSQATPGYGLDNKEAQRLLAWK